MDLPNFDDWKLDTPARLDSHPGTGDEFGPADDDEPEDEGETGNPVGESTYLTDPERSGLVFHDLPW